MGTLFSCPCVSRMDTAVLFPPPEPQHVRGSPAPASTPGAWALPCTPTAHRRTGIAGMQLLSAEAFWEGKGIKEYKAALRSSQSHQVPNTTLERLLSEHSHTSLKIRHQCRLTQPSAHFHPVTQFQAAKRRREYKEQIVLFIHNTFQSTVDILEAEIRYSN